MRSILTILLIFQGVVMGAVLDSIKIKGVEIPLIFEKSDALPIVSMQIIFQKSGSIEDKNLPGLAKFSAKMLNQGTKSLGNVGFANRLEQKAINFGVSCGIETFVLEMSSLKDEYKAGINLISLLLQEPNLTPKAFEKVKINSLGYLSRKEDDFDYVAAINLKKILFKDTPLEYPSYGTIESLEKITLKDVKNFLKEHLVLKRAIVVIGGDLSLKEAKDSIKKILLKLEVGEFEPLKFYDANSKQETKLVKKDTKQAYIYFGSPYYLKVEDDDNYKARVASFILGAGGFGSRLMEEIRVKRGLAYSAYSRVNINRSHSYFSGYLQTKLKSQDEAIKIVKEVIKDFVEKGATKKELDAAKKFLLGSEPLRNETLSQRLSRAFNEYYRGKPLGFSKEELKKIETLTLEELNSFIRSHPEIINFSFSIVTK